MLEMTREYGQEMLAMCKETEAARQAHAIYYLALAEQAAHAWEGPQHALWLGRLERDHDNLRAAMQWSLEQEEDRSRLEVAFRFGAALRSFWQVRGYFREGRAFLERVLAQSEGSQPSWRAKALNDAVLLAVSQGDHAWGEALCQENLLRCRELGDGSAIARTLYLLGWLALLKGNLATAHARLSESLALFKRWAIRGEASCRSSGWGWWSSTRASMPGHIRCSSRPWRCSGSSETREGWPGRSSIWPGCSFLLRAIYNGTLLARRS